MQADLLDGLTTRTVVPLLSIDNAPPALNRLNPKFTLDGAIYIFVVQFIATVPTQLLKNPVGNLRGEADQITSAMDMLFQGF